MKDAKAVCPASLSFIFKFIPNRNIYRRGSIGIGCTVHKKVSVNIESPLPLGCGFGISGAATLATLYALKNYFDIEISYMDLAKIAHKSEIENKTGLGTIATQ